MKRFKQVLLAVAAAGFILACSIASAARTTPDQASIATIVAGTLQAMTPAAPTSASRPAGIPVSFQNVGFVISNGLAGGATAQAVPNNPDDQNGGPWAVAPAHIEFTLNGYNLPPGHFSRILIDIYPAQEYASMYDGAKISLQRLRAALLNPAAPLTNDNLPQVPYFNAASMFVAQVKTIQFQNGSGLRMITQYGQAVGPVANNGTFYHFEGLTADGKYYIVAVLPIQAPFLANDDSPAASTPPAGIPFPGYNQSDPGAYDNYFKAVAEKMNALSNDAFSPSLTSLDGLVQSITIHPKQAGCLAKGV
ncbi:MAG TPA: hypothetical protein VLZ89_05440 [Anaerolineales bacterium]|nr:hypothetical protein [Anaerolineales bacterium]